MENINFKEILAAQYCNKTSSSLIQDFKKTNEPWKVCSEESGLIQNFGKEAGEAYNKFTSIFDIETQTFMNTKSYATTRSLFVEDLISLITEIFNKLVTKLKEFSFQSFRETISMIQISNNIDQEVKNSIILTEKYFTSNSKHLKPFFIENYWIINKEKRELLNGIREIAIERLQLARLQGVYLQKSRNPVSLSFHFLHPHLFGKDLSLNNFSSTDSFDFNPEPNKRAGLMRQFVETSGNSAKIKIGGNFTNQSSDDFVYHKDPLKLFNDE